MAKRSSRKLTANQREYAKQVKRIKQAIRRAEKRGYRFTEDVLPQKPKRITQKEIQKLKQIKGDTLYDKATFLDQETGEIVKGTEGRKLERKESARKSAETRKRKKQQQEQQYYPNGGDIIANNVVDDFISKLSEPEPALFPYHSKMARQIELTLIEMRRSKTTLLSLTYSKINEIGKSGLGWLLQENADIVSDCIQTIVYIGSSAEAVASACRELAQVINGSPLTFAQLQDLAEQEEYNESHEYPL